MNRSGLGEAASIPLDPTAVVHMPLIRDFYNKGVDNYDTTTPNAGDPAYNRKVTDPSNPSQAITIPAGDVYFDTSVNQRGLWFTASGQWDRLQLDITTAMQGATEWTAEVTVTHANIVNNDNPISFACEDVNSSPHVKRVGLNMRPRDEQIRAYYQAYNGDSSPPKQYGDNPYTLTAGEVKVYRMTVSLTNKQIVLYVDGVLQSTIDVMDDSGLAHTGIAKFFEYGLNADGVGTGVGGDSLDGDGGYWLRDIKFWDSVVLPDLPNGLLVDLPLRGNFDCRGVDNVGWASVERVVTNPDDGTALTIPAGEAYFHPEHGLWCTGDGTWDWLKADIRTSLEGVRQWTVEFKVKFAAISMYDIPVIFNAEERVEAFNTAKFGIYPNDPASGQELCIFYRDRDSTGAKALGSTPLAAGDEKLIRVTSNADTGEIKAYVDGVIFCDETVPNLLFLTHRGWFKFTEYGLADNDDGTGSGVGGDSLDGDGGYWLKDVKFFEGIVPPSP